MRKPKAKRRALTVRQPWAWAIVEGLKRVENRPKRTHLRERIYIHAGRLADPKSVEHCRRLCAKAGVKMPDPKTLITRALIGTVTIYDCVPPFRNAWAFGPWCWLLEKPRKLARPIPMSGALGFWTPNRSARTRKLKTRKSK